MNNGLYQHHQRPLHTIGTLICALGIMAIAFSIALRAIPNSLNPVLLSLLPFTHDDLNHLYASYQYYLIVCLIFSGLFVDIVGPRTVLVLNLTLAIIANYIFAKTNSVVLSLDSRLLISFTHTFILTGVLTLGTHWLPRRHFSLYVGLTFGALLMMPLIVAPPLKNIFTRDTLQLAVLLINLVGVFIIIGLILTERVADKTRHRHTLAGLVKPLTHYKVWLISLVAMLGWMCITFITDYGTFYLIKHFHYSPLNAVDTSQTAFVFFGIGAILMGLFSDYLEKKRFLIAAGYLVAAIIFGMLIFIPDLSTVAVAKLLFLAAFFSSSTIICYTKANDYCTIGNSGITMGFVLSICTIGNSLFAKMMGHLLRAYVNDPNQESFGSWELILLILPCVFILGALISVIFLRPQQLKPVTFLPAGIKM